MFSFLISPAHGKDHNFIIVVISAFLLSMLASLVMVKFTEKLYRMSVQKCAFFVVLLCFVLFLLLQRVTKYAGNPKPVSGYNKQCHCLPNDRRFAVMTAEVVWATWKNREHHLLASHCHEILLDLPSAFMKCP